MGDGNDIGGSNNSLNGSNNTLNGNGLTNDSFNGGGADNLGGSNLINNNNGSGGVNFEPDQGQAPQPEINFDNFDLGDSDQIK